MISKKNLAIYLLLAIILVLVYLYTTERGKNAYNASKRARIEKLINSLSEERKLLTNELYEIKEQTDSIIIENKKLRIINDNLKKKRNEIKYIDTLSTDDFVSELSADGFHPVSPCK